MIQLLRLIKPRHFPDHHHITSPQPAFYLSHCLFDILNAVSFGFQDLKQAKYLSEYILKGGDKCVLFYFRVFFGLSVI